MSTFHEWRRDNFLITDDPAHLDFEATCRLLWSTYWAVDRSAETIAESLRNSLNFALFDGATQIGFARMVTDYSTVGYLCDVVLAEEYRGAGLGKWLIATILAHPRLAGCRIDLFTRDAQEFYRQYGFGPHRFTSMVRYPTGGDAGR